MEKEGFARLFHNFDNVIEPKLCSTSGSVPSYLKGTMLRNGPGMFEIGDTKYQHWFDGMGFIQRYHFEDGKVSGNINLHISEFLVLDVLLGSLS